MFKIAILCLFFYTISGLELKPSCKTCKWFIPGNNVKNPDYGLCKMFKNTYQCDGNESIMYDFAVHCRNNEKLCGKKGYLYEDKTKNQDEDEDKKEISKIADEYEELKNRCCGEVNEIDEIDEIEREFLLLFQRLKKYKRNQIETFAKTLYEIFKDKLN